ncbi:MAG: DUF5597 domain-containing protein [Acidobacteriota bacterium]
MRFACCILSILVLLALGSTSLAQDRPEVRIENGTSQFLLNGKQFLMLAGELGNSSSGTAAQADAILPRLAKLHFNTVLMPVAWDQIEPAEGQFDFSIPDHWIDVARHQHLHLVFLWFGSWKNAFSEYAPQWVLADTHRFPRAFSADGAPLEILSPLGEEIMRADSRAFAALMRHLRATDSTQQTVLMIQVENEIGVLGLGGRDRSNAANRLFAQPVPAPLLAYIRSHRTQLTPEIAAQFNPAGNNWHSVFGDAADEIFMAWHYAQFVNQVAAAGKKEYALPMYMNAQLPAPFERAGDYPSGGPYPSMQPVYRAAAPALDFFAPDIYWPDFEQWIERYQRQGNPVFVPEARLDVAPFNALYTFGQARGFGFSPFAVDSLPATLDATQPGPALSDEYQLLDQLQPLLIAAQQNNATRALVLHELSMRPSQTVSLGGYLFRASLARTWPARSLAEKDGAMLVMETGPNEFYILGAGLTVDFQRDPDTDNQAAGIAAIDRLAFVNGNWIAQERLNGDQSNQGRQLLMAAHAFHVYRVRLYTYSREQAAAP